MKTTTLLVLALSAALPAARAVQTTLTANFDALGAPVVAGTLNEGGLTFDSPTGFYVVSRWEAGVIFGAGGPYFGGNAIAVGNLGWANIGASGGVIDALSFKYGFDWSVFAIANGMVVTLDWQALLGGVLVETGSQSGAIAGTIATVNPQADFDTLKLRSVSSWYGGENHIAFDNVTAVLAETPQIFAAGAAAQGVPDAGRSLVLLCCALGVVAFFKRLYA